MIETRYGGPWDGFQFCHALLRILTVEPGKFEYPFSALRCSVGSVAITPSGSAGAGAGKLPQPEAAGRKFLANAGAPLDWPAVEPPVPPHAASTMVSAAPTTAAVYRGLIPAPPLGSAAVARPRGRGSRPL